MIPYKIATKATYVKEHNYWYIALSNNGLNSIIVRADTKEQVSKMAKGLMHLINEYPVTVGLK